VDTDEENIKRKAAAVKPTFLSTEEKFVIEYD
jgi:hypothetical protein